MTIEDSEAKKLIEHVCKIEDQAELEILGKSLNPKKFLLLLSSSKSLGKDFHVKLRALLAGISPSTFHQSLAEAGSLHIEILKGQALIEQMQHHLTLFQHQAARLAETVDDELKSLDSAIDSLDPALFSFKEVADLHCKIECIAERYKSLSQILQKALSIAWQTNRIDLIDHLSQIKEHVERPLNTILGHPRTNTHHPSGLYRKIEQRLFKSQNDLDPRDPAIEALASFAVWYPADYFEAGLIDQLPGEASDEKEQRALDKQLLQNVTRRLADLNLNTVQDIQKAQIFSKKSLADYIRKQKRPKNGPF